MIFEVLVDEWKKNLRDDEKFTDQFTDNCNDN